MNEQYRKTILLVEDEAVIAMAEKQQLERIGYLVDHVFTGEAAVVTALDKSSRPDLILMDIDLGKGLDGTEAAEEILKEIEIPVVFLSSHTEPEVVEKTEKITSYGYVVKNSAITVLDTSIKMAFRLFDANRTLAESEKKYYQLFQHSINAFALHEMIYDENGEPVDYRYIAVNPAFEKITGLSADEVVNRRVSEVMPNTESYWISTYGKVARTGESVVVENYAREIQKHVEVSVFQPKQDQFACVFTDITARKRTEEELRQMALIIENVDSIATLKDTALRYRAANKAHLRLTGLQSITELVGKTDRELFKGRATEEQIDTFMNNDRNALKLPAGQIILTEEFVTAKDGGTRTFLTKKFPIYDEKNETVLSVATLTTEITDRKRVEEKIQQQLVEKETLLKEVHHRIKNNMAQIESLLSVQVRTSDNGEVKSAIEVAISRVRSIRTLYEKLLLREDYREVSIKEYLESLIRSIVDIFQERRGVSVETSIADFRISSGRAIPIGIMLNELLTNVFKYAFEDTTEGRVHINLEKTGAKVTLTIQDDGIGIDQHAMEKNTSGFGLSLVNMLVEQLDGTVAFDTDNGVRCVLTIVV